MSERRSPAMAFVLVTLFPDVLGIGVISMIGYGLATEGWMIYAI